jgi:hypothetical protein
VNGTSVYVIEQPPPYWLGLGRVVGTPKLKYVAGPLAGTSVPISWDQFEATMREMARKYGILGYNWRHKPVRFIPGTEQHCYWVHGQFNDGYFDENGYHDMQGRAPDNLIPGEI